ncbi:MAG: hypothetical protein R3E39_12895 [Anaerolineae bacterium]
MRLNILTRINRLPLSITAALGFAILVVGLWLPYGFNISAQSDEWVHMALLARVPFNLQNDIRPLLRLPWAIAHVLTPDSFLGLNLLLALTFYIKGLALYGIVRRLLPSFPALAYAAGILLIIYPGDFGTFNLITTGISVSLACWLVAAYFLLVYWQRPGILPLLVMWGFLFVAVGIVEIVYPLVLFTPLLLVFLEGRFNRRMLLAAALWYAAPIFLVTFAALQSLAGSNVLDYQSTRFAADNSIPTLIVAAVQPYRWLFWDIWQQVISSTPVRLVDRRTVVAFVVVIVNSLVLVIHARPTNHKLMLRHWGVLVVGALGVMTLGFAVFLPSILRDLQERTLLFTQVGVAVTLALLAFAFIRFPRFGRYGIALLLVIAAVAIYVQRNGGNRFVPLLLLVMAAGFVTVERLRYALLVSGCVGLFMGSAFALHEVHIQRGRIQQPYLIALAQAAPRFTPDTTVLIYDEASDETLYSAFWRRNDVFGSAVQFIYDDPSLRAFLCWDKPDIDAPDLGTCQITNDGAGVVYDPRYQPTYIQPISKLVVLIYKSDGTMQVLESLPDNFTSGSAIEGYQPYSHIVTNSDPPPHLNSVFELQ